MAEKNKLSIYLIKDEFASNDAQILKTDLQENMMVCPHCDYHYRINAKKRMLYGKDSMNPPSRFLNDINENDLENLSVKTENNSFVSSFESSIDTSITYNFGEKVLHDEYGEGVIVGIDEKLISVAFPHPIGIKKFIKGHKCIRKVEE